MAELSPKLQERRRQRESRIRPWKDSKLASPESIDLSRLSLGSPSSTPTRKPYLRRSIPIPLTIGNHSKFRFRRAGPFPFQRLPYDLQLLVGEFVVQLYRKPMKCEDFIPYKDANAPPSKRVTPPRRALSRKGWPVWIPFLQVCPWLAKDLTRTWYKHNIFYAKTVEEWNAFIKEATWDNVHRIRHLHVDNELIYCTGESVGEDEKWRSNSLLSPLKNLKILTLYRDDGGPGTYTHGGHDDFNSVEWFVKFADDCKTVEHIRFALYPWSGFDKYNLKDSNMVAWVDDWKHEWEAILKERRPAKEKVPQSWYLTTGPTTVSSL